jgi:hypothetical protein
VALKKNQLKSQVLFKAMQRVDKKLYILPLCDVDHPLNGDCKMVMKPEDMPMEYDEMPKFAPELYVRTEPEQLYVKWLVAHDIPMEEELSQMSHTFWCEQHPVYIHYLQYDEVVDAGLFIYSHWNLNADHLTEFLSTMSG